MTGDWTLREVPLDHPDPVALTALAQEYYVEIYGGPDATPFEVAEFAPPYGLFLVGYFDHRAVAMGGWRFRDPARTPYARWPAEIKRMFVHPEARGVGLARRVLAELERTAAAAGADWLVLETGRPQVAAVALYKACGYGDVAPFGYYADEPEVVSLGKPLSGTLRAFTT